MLFTEPSFLFFFLPPLLVAHVLAPARARNLLLLAASLVFYAWGEPVFVLGLLGETTLAFALALAIERARSTRAAGAWLAAAVVCFLALLGAFKYAGFVVANLSAVSRALGGPPLWADFEAPALPIGISFFTFQAISYVVDVRRGTARAQRSPIDAALYIAMFPQLIAGPIVRYADVAAQLRERSVALEDVALGARRFAIGLAKKLWIANVLAEPADAVFGLAAAAPGAVPGVQDLDASLAWLGALAFALQIYFDFSGYSDMAIGLARMFGFAYRENFEHPYTAGSVTAFWRRWHVSLSSWFRDYVYVPLGGSRGSRLRTLANLWIVFLLCGAWHGARWTFIVWGVWHGALLVLERLALRDRLALRATPARTALTFLLVVLGFVIFRADSLGAAGRVFAALGGAGGTPTGALPLAALLDTRVALALAAGLVGMTPWPARLARRALGLADLRLPADPHAPPAPLRAVAAAPAGTRARWLVALRSAALAGLVGAALLACAAQIAAGTYQPFIYFRF